MLLQTIKAVQTVRIDTVEVIKTVRDTVIVSKNDSLEILDKVNGFYHDSFSNLLWVVGILISIGVFVVPFAIQWYQTSQLKLNKEKLITKIEKKNGEELTKLKKEIETEFRDALEKLKQEIKSEYEESLAKLERDNNTNMTSTVDKIKLDNSTQFYHLQGLTSYTAGKPEIAAFNILTALKFGIQTDATEKSKNRFFNNAIQALNKSKKELLAKMEEGREENIQELIDAISKVTPEEFNHRVIELQKAYDDLK